MVPGSQDLDLTVPVGSSGMRQRFDLRHSLTANAPFLIVAASYIIIAAVIFTRAGLPLARPSSYVANFTIYCAAAAIVIGPAFLFRLAIDRPQKPFAYARPLVRDWRLYDRLILALPAVIALIFFMPVFSAFKSAIPAFHAYSFDPLFVRWDEAIHGRDAWQLIHPLVGHPFITYLLNWAYHLWIVLLYVGVVLVAAWVERPRLRMQFLLSYALAWPILGTLCAIFLASVGPCFYDDFYGNDRFAPLMEYLAQTDQTFPLGALNVQERLLVWANDGSNGIGRGISAMPSMHLSIACLFAILGWRVSRLWGTLATVFMLLILLGSVHLGYHYAVDGYAAIGATLAIWWLSGVVLSKFPAGQDET
jgi:hypothetical protein